MAMGAPMGMTMADWQAALYTLQTWFSPSFPIGAYTYSHGLENVVEQGKITNVEEAMDWLRDMVAHGNGYADAVFLCAAYDAVLAKDGDALAQVSEYAAAFCGTAELRLESQSQGAACLEAIQKITPNGGIDHLVQCWSGPYPYVLVIGVSAAALDLDREAVTTAFLHGFVSNLSSALVRLVPLGQSDGQRLIAELAPLVLQTTKRALTTPWQEVSTATLMVDIASMAHETQYTRLFRS